MRKQPDALTEREQEVLVLIAAGLSNDNIAEELGLSRHTVAWYIRQIFSKLDVKRRTQAVAVARLQGLLRDTAPTRGTAGPEANRESTISHNLPTQPTSFIGREHEIEAVAALLNDSACRLVTLVGPGGIGKTRLAVEVARHTLNNFGNGVYFVPLHSVTSSHDIVPTIAASAGLRFQIGDRTPQKQLIDYLHSKTVLLLLDNFEHLLDAAPLVSSLLAAAPSNKILVTSREALNLREEFVYYVDGLQVPEANQVPSYETFSALELFTERARRTSPEFTLSAELSDVVRVCKLTGGMPLAIELAATWTNMLSCAEIAEEIERGLAILASPLRNIPERHRSIKVVFDGSWKRLIAGEQATFRRLAVFRGGFTREAAQNVTGADLHTLQTLVEKSFIRRDASSGRFDVHDLLRQYSEAKLAVQEDEHTATLDRHARYFARLVYEHEQALHDLRDHHVDVQIHHERDNIDRAWRWAVEQNMVEEIGKFAAAMNFYLQARGLFAYGSAMYERMADALRGQPESDQRNWSLGRVLAHWGWTLHVQGRHEAARHLLEESLALLEQLEQGSDWALSMGFLGDIKRAQGDVTATKQLLHEALVKFRTLEIPHGIWMALQMLGVVAHQAQEWEEARDYFLQALHTAQHIDTTLVDYLYTLPFLVTTHIALGDLAESRQYLHDILELLATNRAGHNALASSYILAAMAHYFVARQQDREAFEVLALIAEHPLCSGEIKQQMQPHLTELADHLPTAMVDDVRQSVQETLVAISQSQPGTFLPRAYFVRLRQLLDDS